MIQALYKRLTAFQCGSSSCITEYLDHFLVLSKELGDIRSIFLWKTHHVVLNGSRMSHFFSSWAWTKLFSWKMYCKIGIFSLVSDSDRMSELTLIIIWTAALWTLNSVVTFVWKLLYWLQANDLAYLKYLRLLCSLKLATTLLLVDTWPMTATCISLPV